MKRSLILACVSALVVALGLSATAVAEVSATAVASKGAKKGKSCKGKAGKSAASAQAKKKGKGCAKGKAKGATLSSGTYEDASQSLKLTVSGGSAVLEYVPPGFCVAINYTSESVPLTESGGAWKASENRYFSLVGEPATAKWDLSVNSKLEYVLNFKLEGKTMIGPCEGEGHPKGTLTKVG